jgi:hypothetical protein
MALPVLDRTEDALAEESVAFGLERSVVDRLRLGDLAVTPRPDLLGRCDLDLDPVEVGTAPTPVSRKIDHLIPC